MALNHAHFRRLVSRCAEIAGASDPASTLAIVYRTGIEAPLRRYLDATHSVDRAMDRWNQALADRVLSLKRMDAPFRAARSVVAAMRPWAQLPLTLKVQPTDTDKRDAILDLMARIAKDRGSNWADLILDGDIGRQAAVTVRCIDEAIEAGGALQRAQAERTRVFKEAKEAFFAFKRLVRDTFGAASISYRRLHSRSASTPSDLVPRGREEADSAHEPSRQDPTPRLDHRSEGRPVEEGHQEPDGRHPQGAARVRPRLPRRAHEEPLAGPPGPRGQGQDVRLPEPGGGAPRHLVQAPSFERHGADAALHHAHRLRARQERLGLRALRRGRGDPRRHAEVVD